MGYLRTILAITVVLAHSPWNGGAVFVGGRNAVQLFYLISGFLIAHVLRTNPAYRDSKKFYLNRALRIYPLYYAVVLLTLVSAVLFRDGLDDFYRQASASVGGLLVTVNATIFGQDWIMFSRVHDGHLGFAVDFTQSDLLLYRGLVVPQAWTLGLELTFYALAPLILRRTSVILTLFGWSVVARLLLLRAGLATEDPWSYRFFPTELALFLAGALANHHLLPFWQRRLATGKLHWLPGVATALLVAVVIFYSCAPLGIVMKTAILFIFFMTLLPLAFVYQDRSKSDRAVGELSYPIYISHLLVIGWAGHLLEGLHADWSPFSRSILNVLLSCLVAYGLNRLVTDRLTGLRARVRSGR